VSNRNIWHRPVYCSSRLSADRAWNRHLAAALCLLLGALSSNAVGRDAPPALDQKLLDHFAFRAIGPYRAGSWVTDFAVPETPADAHLYTVYVGTRNGGLWKTTNNGTTFEPLFDGQSCLSIGAVAVAPSNPDVVWVGTGEAYNARSSYRGDGVYRSTDAGKSWQDVGLKDTHHIAKVVVHPSNADIAYVAAMGHLYSRNAERGLFRTTDGGRSWKKVLFVNDGVGVIDVAMNRSRPEVLYAATYQKERLPWHFEEGGPESGIYKTTNGGESWRRLTGGLPTGKIGRIGLDIYQKNPDVLYAVVENANMRAPTPEEAERDRKAGRLLQDRMIGSDVYRTDDGGATWKQVDSSTDEVGAKAPYSFNMLRIDPNDDQKVFVTGVSLTSTADGGKTWRDIDEPEELFAKMFGDVRTVWIDPENSKRILLGSDGGVHISYDGGTTCDHLDNLPLGEFYAVGVDMEDPYNLYGGLQDHESWKGPSNGWSGQVGAEDWVTTGVQDGMYNQVDPEDCRWLYNTYQFGGHRRVDQKLGTKTDIQPRRKKGEPPYRFNWTPPVHLSPHNSRIVYTGSQLLLRSMNRGDDWQEISPDLTTNDPKKTAGRGYISYCTITAIAESPLRPGIIWVGTDDGKVWLTLNGGAQWQDLTAPVTRAGAPENYWVSRICASHHDAATAYVCKTGLRNDDFRPFLFTTTDSGRTWAACTAGLPGFSVNVIVEDSKNPDLLFCGTDAGLYVSVDAGKAWMRMSKNMPSVRVTDLVIHPRENDLIVGTYGRGLYMTDIGVLRELRADTLLEDVHLFDIEPVSQLLLHGWGSYQAYGDRHLAIPNQPNAIAVTYYLREACSEKVKITVRGLDGALLKEIEGPCEAGLHTVLWDMQRKPSEGSDVAPWEYEPELEEPGDYVVTLAAGGKEFVKRAVIRARIGWPIGPVTARHD